MAKVNEKNGKKTILIVDDEEEACGMICSYLRRRGFDARAAYTGKEALEVLKKTIPHLIILDVIMPVMDGFEFLRHLKFESNYSEIPVIMLTAKTEPANIEKGISLQADFYLPKPFEFDNLMNFINLVL